MKLQGVIFDMDGLLFDSEILFYEKTQEVADEMGLPYSKETYLRYLGMSDEEVMAGYHQEFADFGPEKVEELIEEAYKRTYEVYEKGAVELKLGAKNLLDWLKEEEIPCVLASSNNRHIIDVFLKEANLNSYFKGIFSGDTMKHAKPHPEIFNRSAEFLQLPKENLLILEDSYHGIVAGKRAGIPVYLVPDLLAPTLAMKKEATKIFANLNDVKTYLEAQKN